jgi:CubicO group peptidase (beta-lactamase class C family)
MRHRNWRGAGFRAGLCWAALLVPVALAQAEAVSRDSVVAALPKLGDMAQAQIESGGVPGLAIAVVHDDEVVYLEGFGLREMGKSETVDPDTVFQLASMSKPISATVVAALVSKGVVDWSTRVADLAPEFRLRDPYPTAEVTIRDFFNHRSGLPGTSGDDLEDIGYGRDHVLHQLRLVPPSSSFRAGYSYSNAGFTMGAVAAVRPTGQDWETVAADKLFGPLGMASTSYRHGDFLERQNAAALHVRAGGAWAAKFKRDPSVQAPAGGVSSTARDLTQWMRLELGKGVLDGERVISADALAATHEPLFARGASPVAGGASFYGLGWGVAFGRHGLSWRHAGAFSAGGRSLVTLYPDAGLGIVVLSNAFPTGVPEALADSFFDLVFDGSIGQDYFSAWNAVYESLFGPVITAAKARFAHAPVPPNPALPDAAYLGDYANDYVGPAKVALRDGVLTLVLGPEGAQSYPLRHFDRDLFLYIPDPEMPDKLSALGFAVGSDGRAEAMTIESLDSNGLGTLRRNGT